jgi:hypothetical protein
MSRSVNLCPPPKMFWDLKYGAPRTADLIIFLAIMMAIGVSESVARFDTEVSSVRELIVGGGQERRSGCVMVMFGFDTGEWCNAAGVCDRGGVQCSGRLKGLARVQTASLPIQLFCAPLYAIACVTHNQAWHKLPKEHSSARRPFAHPHVVDLTSTPEICCQYLAAPTAQSPLVLQLGRVTFLRKSIMMCYFTMLITAL